MVQTLKPAQFKSFALAHRQRSNPFVKLFCQQVGFCLLPDLGIMVFCLKKIVLYQFQFYRMVGMAPNNIQCPVPYNFIQIRFQRTIRI